MRNAEGKKLTWFETFDSFVNQTNAFASQSEWREIKIHYPTFSLVGREWSGSAQRRLDSLFVFTLDINPGSEEELIKRTPERREK